MATSPSVTLTTAECPQCGRHSIVPLSEGVYHCLHCDFHKDVNQKPKDDDDGGIGGRGLFSILAFLIVIALFA